MSALAAQTAQMLSLLPDEDVSIVNALVKKLVRAWDPDFTKVTDAERARLDEAYDEMEAGEYIAEDDVWSEVINS